MSSTTLVSMEEYLATSYRPDCDYVDGEVRERNVGQYEHSNLHGAVIGWLGNRERGWNIRVLPALRLQISQTRFRVPDICVFKKDTPIEPVFTRPPLICIEILSKDDTLRGMRERVSDYLNFGVPNIWILDPALPMAYVCTREGFREVQNGVLSVVDSPIAVPLIDVFGDLD